MKDSEIKVLLDEWYISMIDLQDEKALKCKKKIENLYSNGTQTEYEKRFQLMQIRYYLMIKDYESVHNGFLLLGEENDIPETSKYYYHLFNAILLFDTENYSDALNSFLKAENCLDDTLNPLDTAECKYRLSRVYFRLGNTSKSIQEALMGLEIFQKKNNELGVAFCKNLLGLNSTLLRQFREAESHYQYVRRYAEKEDNQKIKCMIYLNLGDLYSDIALPHKAIEYLKKAYLYTWGMDYNHPMRILYLLAKQYFIIGKMDQAVRMTEKGLKWVQHKNKEFKLLFELLKAKYLPETTDVEQVYQNGLDYFRKKELWGRVQSHSEDFAVFYQEQNRFQEAVKYYDLSVQARKIIEEKGTDI